MNTALEIETVSQEDTERFWSMVLRLGPDDCWLWIGRLTTKRYGQFSLHGREMATHRVAYRIERGQIDNALHVCHTCDIRYALSDLTYRRCVNPAHLFLGTNADNVADKVSKGRQARLAGDGHGRSVLTSEQVDVIRSRYEPQIRGEPRGRHGVSGRCTLQALADEFGMSRSQICKIVNRDQWS